MAAAVVRVRWRVRSARCEDIDTLGVESRRHSRTSIGASAPEYNGLFRVRSPMAESRKTYRVAPQSMRPSNRKQSLALLDTRAECSLDYGVFRCPKF